MKALIEYDKNGVIRAIGTRTAKSSKQVQLSFRPRPGYTVAEVETHNVRDEKDFKAFVEFKKCYQITARRGKASLIRKK